MNNNYVIMDYDKEISFGAFDSELMHQEIYIPEGFTATIEGDKIILTRIESEDERIRKELIGFLRNNPNGNYTCEEMAAWLEKQGEHANFLSKIQVGDKVTRNKDGVLVNLSQLNRVAKPVEKQGEQKPTDEDMKEALRTEYEKGRADAFAQMQKEWSEEDEKIRQNLMSLLSDMRRHRIEESTYQKYYPWLKSLKERIGE